MGTYIRVGPPFAALMIQDRSRKEQYKYSKSQKENRPVYEHCVRSRLLEVQPHEEPLEKEEETW